MQLRTTNRITACAAIGLLEITWPYRPNKQYIFQLQQRHEANWFITVKRTPNFPAYIYLINQIILSRLLKSFYLTPIRCICYPWKKNRRIWSEIVILISIDCCITWKWNRHFPYSNRRCASTCRRWSSPLGWHAVDGPRRCAPTWRRWSSPLDWYGVYGPRRCAPTWRRWSSLLGWQGVAGALRFLFF